MLKAMRRIVYLALIPAALAAVLIGFSGYFVRHAVTGQKDALLGELSRRSGVVITAGGAGFDLAGWYALRPALSLDDLKIGNPPGFQEPHLLTARRASVRVALGPLWSRRLEVETLVMDDPVFVIERTRQGTSNLEVFSQGLSAKGEEKATSGAGAPGVALSIQSLEVRNGDWTLVKN